MKEMQYDLSKLKSGEDEFDVFGKYIAKQLKKLSTEQALLGQDEIQRMKKFREKSNIPATEQEFPNFLNEKDLVISEQAATIKTLKEEDHNLNKKLSSLKKLRKSIHCVDQSTTKKVCCDIEGNSDTSCSINYISELNLDLQESVKKEKDKNDYHNDDIEDVFYVEVKKEPIEGNVV
ncbi:unnamed protein product [Leptosia nina]|uniref:Uncharacterized protein n=1 Tax=Leptosia nina TaxID=320188 RepID=A0AAV1JLD9_9NEOP